MSSVFASSFIISIVVMIVSVVLVVYGQHLRKIKSSKGLSASSNDTSAGTGLMVCGVLLFLTQSLNLLSSLF